MFIPDNVLCFIASSAAERADFQELHSGQGAPLGFNPHQPKPGDLDAFGSAKLLLIKSEHPQPH